MFQQIISSIGIDTNDLLGYVVLYPFIFLWIWSILYTTKDISQRTDSMMYQLLMILLVFLGTPLLGFPLYFIFRPEKKKDILLSKVIDTITIECLECGTLNDKNNQFCVSCGDSLKIDCKECKKKYYVDYDYCPHCGAPNLEIE